MLQILHNPRCGKSRNCLAFLNESDIEYEIINYLENPYSKVDLEILIAKLGINPIDLVRQKEKLWIENFKGKSLSDTDVINALAKYPNLIERPIVIKGEKAIIGRELQKLKSFI